MEMRLVASARRTWRWGVLGAALLAFGALAGRGTAQGPQILPLPPGVPHHVGPGTQGTPVYQGPTFESCSASGWLCDVDDELTTLIGMAEVADDLHMTEGGVLASFTFTYVTSSLHGLGLGVTGPVGLGNDVTA